MRFCSVLFLLTIIALAHAQEAPAPGTELIEVAKRKARTGEFAQAVAALDQFEQTKRPTWQSLDLRGCILLEQGKIDEAAKMFSAAQADDGSAFPPRLHAVDVLFRQRKYEEARTAYRGLLGAESSLIENERVHYVILLACLALHDETEARTTFEGITFPTKTPAYYYAQAAWHFSHGKERDAKKWVCAAEGIFEAPITTWFARPLYDFGWIKKKPLVTVD